LIVAARTADLRAPLSRLTGPCAVVSLRVVQTSQQKLGFLLAVFASLVLLLGTLQRSAVGVLTARQAWMNLAVAVVVSGVLAWPFPGLVQAFCMVMRMTAPAAAVFALVRSRYDLIAPLVLLGLVFQFCLWLADFVAAGGTPRRLPRAAAAGLRRAFGRHERPPGGPGNPPAAAGVIIVRAPAHDGSEPDSSPPPTDTVP